MFRLVPAAVLITGCGLTPGTVLAQPGLTRTELQRHDLSAAGWESVQARIDFAPGAVAGRHTRIPAKRSSTSFKARWSMRSGETGDDAQAGEVLFIPAGTIHAARNVGSGIASELATYVVEKGKPLVTPAN